MFKRVHDPLGTSVAAGFVLLGLVLAWTSQSMTAMGSVFPITISSAMAIVGLILIVRNIILGIRGMTPVSRSTGEGGVEGGSNMRRLLFVAAMIAWIALLPVLGFLVASALAYFAIMIVAIHERMSVKEIALLIVLGFAILVGFYALMSEILLIPMPRGLFF
ncbi:TRAP-T family transporter, fused small and large inner membrane subunits [Fulvimarina pelagi HTCC2506]|uniref:TRAP-T family transporter, fused small and large inner membrane subunits n=1 Tax=Fulvimarina pelagi HTCC2506 TaxID=314231 RepID=Q0G471_9HYPH|nr:tripartite tricarboxylate transporter TctB family protein [Fulvimarina pelagi]EAU41610.1 TRAP-T family transporter, fused small and large inner membrane subunits [Fulvimarina pelagi HTCC2506]